MVSSGLCPCSFWGERKQEPGKGQRMKHHLTFYALHHMHKRSCRRPHIRYQVLFRSRPQRSCDVRYYCWCHYYLWSLAQTTDASQSAGCLESVVYFRIEIGVSIWFLEIANLSTCASVFRGFSSVFSFSWSILESEAGSKTNFEPATNKCQIDTLLEKAQQQHTVC